VAKAAPMMQRRSAWVGLGIAWACLLALLAPVGARAEGKPNIGFAVAGPNSLLYGTNATFALEADNPTSEPYGYNLSYRAVLPKGVSYVAASTKLGSGATVPAPAEYHNAATGETTLVWSNVGDLSASSRETLGFEAKPSLSEYTVGGHFTVQAGAYISEKPRFVPKFSATGEPVGASYTGSATGAGGRTISALEVTQSEGSPEGEILRGTQDQQTVYAVKVTNNSVAPTSEVEVEEWLPADLEFLGCAGAADHTTDAPTNPGSKEEYPGSGPITIAKPTSGEGCAAPEIVKTETTTPPGASAAGIYTLVRWKPGTLAAGGTQEYKFAAAVPLRENTKTWPGGVEPEPASGKQAANLDNNSGKETTDGEPIVTYAQAKGKFEATKPVSASDQLERTAKDLRTEKTASTSKLADGEVTVWTIKTESSEYRFNTGITVTDTLPNGLCPLDQPNLTSSTECEPTGATEDLPHPAFASATEATNGTWALVWNETSDPELASLAANGTATITFASKTRTHYQKNGKPAEPILAHDTVENSVLAAGTTHVVCAAHASCAEGASGHIDHERPLSEAIHDESHVTQTAEGPSIDKEVATAGIECKADEYTKNKPVYHPGDLICWHLQAIFPELLSTKGSAISDLLPSSVFFEPAFNGGKGEAAVGEDNLPGTTFDHSEATKTEAGGALSWTLPNSGVVSNGKFIFERVFQTLATLEKGTQPGDLQGNLMKFNSTNSKGESFPERSEADFELQFPQLTLAKQIVAVGGKAITPVSTATVKGGEEVTFALTLSNRGKQEAEQAEVRENLATGLTCAEVVSKTNLGVCGEETVEGKPQAHITWGDIGLGGENIKVPAASEPTHGTLTPGEAKLEFTLRLPSALDPGDVLKDRAGVAEYKSPTNNGATFTYIPRENIEPLTHPESEANSEKAIGEAELKTEAAKLAKTHTSSVEETGNSAEQATIGEQVTYSVTATVPAGTTLNGVARLSDPGFESSREEYETGSVEALVNGAVMPAGFSTEVVAGKPVVVFPENYSPSPSAATLVTMRFKAHVLNVEANNAAGTATQQSIPNTGELNWTSALGVAEQLTAANPTPLVEPKIALTESNNSGGPVHGGQIVEYKLKAENGGQSAAFDTKLVDTVPSNLTPTTSLGVPLANGGETASGGIWNETARTITWEVGKLAPATSSERAFFVKVNESPVSSTSLENNSKATIASLASGGREAGTPTPAAIKPNYEVSKSSKLTVVGSTIAKSANPTTATIGQPITYTLTVKVPALTSAFNETVIDTLPATENFVRFVSAACESGCSSGNEITPQTYKVTNPTTTTTVAWYLGNLSAAPTERTVKLTYEAVLRAKALGGSEEVKEGGAKPENKANVYYNTENKFSFNENSIPTAVSFAAHGTEVKTPVEPIEPKLTLTKEVSVNGGSFGAGPVTVTDGSKLKYRIKVANSGKVAAYEAGVTDTLPTTGLANIAPIANAAAEPATIENHQIVWRFKGALAPKASITLEYTAEPADAKELKQGQEINNSAVVPSYYGVPIAERTGNNYFNEPLVYREYAGTPAEVKTKLEFPKLTIEKLVGASGTATKGNAEVGQPFTWRVIVKNTSKVAATDVKVSDKLPANWEYVAASAEFSGGHKEVPTQSGSLEPGRELTWSTSIELAAETSTTLTYQAKPTLAAETNPGSGVAGVNEASTQVYDAAGNHENAEGTFLAGPAKAEATLIVPKLAVTKTPLKASVAAGEQDSYTIVVKNTGAGIAREVLAEDTLQAGMTYTPGKATASPTTGFSETAASASAVSWKIASIAAGAMVEITVPVNTEPTLATGKLVNHVAVSAEAAPTPVKAEGTITLTTSADLEAFKSVVSTGGAVPGKQLTYEIGATNNGPSVADAVSLTDKLPATVEYVSAEAKALGTKCSQSAGTVTCEAPELEPKQSVSFLVTVSILPSATGSLSNTVHVTSTTPDPKPENNEKTVTTPLEPQVDLGIEKTAPAAVVTGDDLTWTLNVKNHGVSDAAGVTVSDPLPAGSAYLNSTSTLGSCEDKTEFTCKIPMLAVGESAQIKITAEITAGPGTIKNTATVAGKQTDPEPGNNKSTATTTVTPAPTLLKGSDSPHATIGQRITYTLTATIPAHLAPYGETVIDTLPDTLDFDEYGSAQCTAGCTTGTTPTIRTYEPHVAEPPGTTQVAWYLGDVAASNVTRTITLTYVASVRETARGGTAKVKAGEAIANSAGLYFNDTNKLSFEEKTIPDPAAFDHSVGPVSSTTTVVEPALTLVKEARVNETGEFSSEPFTVTDGDTVDYRLLVKNTGASAAYDTTVTDTPPPGLVEVTTVANLQVEVTKAWTGVDHEIAWKIPGPLAPNETVTLEYHAKLAPVATLKAGQPLTNTAKIPSFFGVAEAERAQGKNEFEGNPIEYREYQGPSAQLTGTVALPSISIEKTTGAEGFPSSANAEVGQPFPWRVVVKNTSTVLAKNLQVTDTLPANWEYVPGSANFVPGGGCVPVQSGVLETGLQLTCSTSIELAPGESTTLTYDAKPTAAAATTPGVGPAHPNINTASAAVQDAAGSSEDADGPFAAGPARAEAILILPSLEITKAPVKASVNAGEGDEYDVDVKNTGSGIAREVVVVDTLPAGMTYEAGKASSTAPGFSEQSVLGSMVTWKLASIGEGESVEINVPIGTEASVPEGSKLTNKVAASSVEQTTPVEAEGTIEITASAELEAKKSIFGGSSAPAPTPGGRLTYVVGAKNNGPSTARAVKLVDKLPASVTFASAQAGCTQSAGTVTCEAGDLEVGHEASFQIVVAVQSAFSGSIENTVLAESPTPDPGSENEARVTVTTGPPSADLALVKTALTPEVSPGQQATFSLVTTNNGPSDAAEAKLVDTLPAGLTYVSATGASCAAIGQEVTCALGTISLGTSVRVDLVTQPAGLGSYTNTATISSLTPDPEPRNNSSEATVKVVPVATPVTSPTVVTHPVSGVSPSAATIARTKVTLRKLVREREVSPGGPLDYRLIVRNAGAQTAQAVRVCDTLPPLTSVLSRGGGHLDGGRVCFTLATLARGREHTFTIVLRADSDARGQILNSATVTGKNFDPARARVSTPVSVAGIAPHRESRVTG
jgi:uncharacterized repeat protein (TIGR01451 family)/fimbrial isopeptide formation D2 family protein